MSLPEHFNNCTDYFEDCLKFFQEYNYLYNVSNVEILIHKVLDKINVDARNIDVFDDNLDLSCIVDEFFNSFFVKLKRLQTFYTDVRENHVELDVDVPVSPKKKHEIIHLAGEIKELCESIRCEVVVDFGSGLGYLDQLIFETTNFKVLGIECNDSHYVGAKKRQRKYHETSIERVKYIKHTITGDSDEKIQVFLQEKFENRQPFCITGLHACADLTIDAIHMFLKMDDAKAIAIMPCCYHKMIAENGRFKNFPLSNCLKDVINKYEGVIYLGVPFLRLAAQPPSVEEKLKDLVFNLLSRAMLELYAQKHNCNLKRNRRKPVKTKTMNNNFETYIQDAANRFTLTKIEPLTEDDTMESPTFDIEVLKTLWNEVTPMTLKMAGIYILLQNYLQPIIENFVLYDRIVYLKENGVESCSFKKILNEKTSPRCLALIAHKASK